MTFWLDWQISNDWFSKLYQQCKPLRTFVDPFFSSLNYRRLNQRSWQNKFARDCFVLIGIWSELETIQCQISEESILQGSRFRLINLINSQNTKKENLTSIDDYKLGQTPLENFETLQMNSVYSARVQVTIAVTRNF